MFDRFLPDHIIIAVQQCRNDVRTSKDARPVLQGIMYHGEVVVLGIMESVVSCIQCNIEDVRVTICEGTMGAIYHRQIHSCNISEIRLVYGIDTPLYASDPNRSGLSVAAAMSPASYDVHSQCHIPEEGGYPIGTLIECIQEVFAGHGFSCDAVCVGWV